MPSPEGETLPVSEMLPESPLRLAIVIVEFAEEPAGTERVPEAVTTLKSSTCTVNCTLWLSDPFVAVMVTV